MQAIHGHSGLPMQLQAPQTGGPIGGAISYPEPATPNSSPVSGSTDRQIAESAATTLLHAAAKANDPALKASFSQALAALHKYIAQDDKERHQALQGKLSPRLMAQAHSAKSAATADSHLVRGV